MDRSEKHEVSVAIIIDSENRIFLQKKDSGYDLGPNLWSLPGGRIEQNENPEKAIKRELLEEMGIDFKESIFESFEDYLFKGELNGHQLDVNHKIFIFKFDRDLSEIRIGEGIGFAFFDAEELDELPMLIPAKEILNKFLKTK